MTNEKRSLLLYVFLQVTIAINLISSNGISTFNMHVDECMLHKNFADKTKFEWSNASCTDQEKLLIMDQCFYALRED